jgi:hypothetical protein
LYRVNKILYYQATRDIELFNEKTGTKDLCFDDSALVSFTNFSFLKEGKTYNCKIKLFGEFTVRETDLCVKVNITNPTITIGKKIMMELKIDNDTYYVPKIEAEKVSLGRLLFFQFTRKDLIQVDDVIHANYL